MSENWYVYVPNPAEPWNFEIRYYPKPFAEETK